MIDDPKIGQDTVIGRGAVVGAGAVIGENVVIGDGAVIGGERSSTQFSLLTPEMTVRNQKTLEDWVGEAECRVYRACEKIAHISEMSEPFNEFTHDRLKAKCVELSLLMQAMNKAVSLHQDDPDTAELFSRALTRIRTPANRSIQIASSLFPLFAATKASDLVV